MINKNSFYIIFLFLNAIVNIYLIIWIISWIEEKNSAILGLFNYVINCKQALNKYYLPYLSAIELNITICFITYYDYRQ